MQSLGTLAARRVGKSHGADTVLEDVTLVVSPRARIGVVGPNGAGKSTLLRLLAGLERPDAGSVERTPGLTVGYLPQEYDSFREESLLGYLGRRTGVAEAERELDRLAAALEREPGLAGQHADALDRFLLLGGEDLEARARAVVTDVGLDPARLHEPMGGLSGGEAARIELAGILLARFDVLLLDEPTNDLDLAGLELLERFLDSTPAALVIVSHDRALLDRCVRRIVELEEGGAGIRDWAGGYAEYEAARAKARRAQYEAHEQYVEKKKRLEVQAQRMSEWEQRGYGQGRKKKKTKDAKGLYRRRMARLELAEKPFEPWELRLSLRSGTRGGDIVARLEDAVVERGRFRLGPIDLELRWRDRVAILGSNGSGKTTLLRALLGKLPLTAGRRVLGTGVVVGELEQDREMFSTEATALDVVRHATGLADEEARTLLAKFDLGPPQLARPSASLSPGERTRAGLAVFVARGVNLLVLDEPTNHLDLPAIEQLETALRAFDGTVVLVSHDRRFLEAFEATHTLRL